MVEIEEHLVIKSPTAKIKALKELDILKTTDNKSITYKSDSKSTWLWIINVIAPLGLYNFKNIFKCWVDPETVTRKHV